MTEKTGNAGKLCKSDREQRKMTDDDRTLTGNDRELWEMTGMTGH